MSTCAGFGVVTVAGIAMYITRGLSELHSVNVIITLVVIMYGNVITLKMAAMQQRSHTLFRVIWEICILIALVQNLYYLVCNSWPEREACSFTMSSVYAKQYMCALNGMII